VTALTLATLGDATRKRNDPISVTPPKVAKAGSDTYCCRYRYHAKLCQWKHGFRGKKVLQEFEQKKN
jgi:hypothetical protein